MCGENIFSCTVPVAGFDKRFDDILISCLFADCAQIGAWFFRFFPIYSALRCAIDFSLSG
jgi:hypothetical protein